MLPRLLVEARVAVPAVGVLRLRLLVHRRGAARGRLEAGGALLGGAGALEQLVAVVLELGLLRVRGWGWGWGWGYGWGWGWGWGDSCGGPRPGRSDSQ